MDESVALYDEHGRPSGEAPRSVMRRDNLRHGATSVIVRNSLGEVYVHRRTETKDVYPGMHDCCAGGVLLAGEDPAEGARREAAEELGVTGAELRPVQVKPYGDEHTRYWAFGFEVTYDGPITWQAAEVASGTWMTLEELDRRLGDPDWPFVPDSRALIADWLAERLAEREPITGGWDSRTSIVEGRWIDREPLRPEIADMLVAESELLPWLAPRLSLAVPRPRVVDREPLRIRHPLIPGTSVSTDLSATQAKGLAAFLRLLGAVPVSAAQSHGLTSAAAAGAEHAKFLADARAEVLPRLSGSDAARGEELLERAEDVPFDTVVHGDLGPAHVLVDGGRLSGVIDWGDAHVGDRARDLAWALYATPQEFAGAFASTYGVTDALTARALVWHRLGPWYEVVHGVHTDRPELVDSGLRGVLQRLTR